MPCFRQTCQCFFFWPLTLTFVTLTSLVKVIISAIIWSASWQSTLIPNLVTVASIVSEKYGKVTFCDLWPWPLWPWPWVKVIITHIIWSASWQSTIMPNLVTVALIVSEKSSTFKFGRLAGRTFLRYAIAYISETIRATVTKFGMMVFQRLV